MHFHWTNDNRDSNDKIAGSGFWAGRAWWHFGGEYGSHSSKSVNVEWLLGKRARFTRLVFEVDCEYENEIAFSVGLYRLFVFYLVIQHPLFTRWNMKRRAGIRVFDNAVWISVWRHPDEYNSKDTWWKKEIIIRPVDMLLGRSKRSEQELSTTETAVLMPEGEYPATVKLFAVTWKRPRWPFPKKYTRANVELRKPVPVPGKGENSWDLDDDAIYELSTNSASTVEEAVQAVYKSAMRDRDKYGGTGWLPVAN